MSLSLDVHTCTHTCCSHDRQARFASPETAGAGVYCLSHWMSIHAHIPAVLMTDERVLLLQKPQALVYNVSLIGCPYMHTYLLFSCRTSTFCFSRNRRRWCILSLSLDVHACTHTCCSHDGRARFASPETAGAGVNRPSHQISWPPVRAVSCSYGFNSRRDKA